MNWFRFHWKLPRKKDPRKKNLFLLLIKCQIEVLMALISFFFQNSDEKRIEFFDDVVFFNIYIKLNWTYCLRNCRMMKYLFHSRIWYFFTLHRCPYVFLCTSIPCWLVEDDVCSPFECFIFYYWGLFDDHLR